MLKAKIFNSPNKGMTGVELRRLRDANGFSQEELAKRMNEWGWYRQKVQDLERFAKLRFWLNPHEMRSLLGALRASSL